MKAGCQKRLFVLETHKTLDFTKGLRDWLIDVSCELLNAPNFSFSFRLLHCFASTVSTPFPSGFVPLSKFAFSLPIFPLLSLALLSVTFSPSRRIFYIF